MEQNLRLSVSLSVISNAVGTGGGKVVGFGATALACFLAMFVASSSAWGLSEGYRSNTRLHFQGGSTFKVVPPNSLLQAVVERVSRRPGSAPTWLVARVEHGSQLDRSTLTYSALADTAADAAESKALTVSPGLPTKVPGLYMVKLRGPGLGKLPPIHYQVSGQIDSQLAAPQTIALVTPRSGEKVPNDFKFKWAAKDLALFYRYELYVSQFVPYFGSQEQESDNDLSTVYQYGRLLPGHIRALSVDTLPTPALSSQSTTYWRVVGLDVGGNTVSVSPLQRVQVQP